jgi:hypothetical protein
LSKGRLVSDSTPAIEIAKTEKRGALKPARRVVVAGLIEAILTIDKEALGVSGDGHTESGSGHAPKPVTTEVVEPGHQDRAAPMQTSESVTDPVTGTRMNPATLSQVQLSPAIIINGSESVD